MKGDPCQIDTQDTQMKIIAPVVLFAAFDLIRLFPALKASIFTLSNSQ